MATESVEAFLRRIRREKIVAPVGDQYVDRCHYSKTGWAVWEKDGACTCKPAKKPKGAEDHLR